MFPLFNTTESLLAVVLMMVAISLWVQKFKIFKSIGPALTVIIMGIILVNVKIVPGYQDIYGTIQTYCVPMSISIYLLNVDLKEMAKLSKQPILALVSAVLSVSIVATVCGIIFGNHLEEGWKVAGMFVGTYTGGSSNLTAIATGLGATNQTIAAANAADYVVGMPTLLLLFAAPALIKASPFIQKIWPYHFTDEELKGDGSHTELMAAEEWSIKDIAWLLALSAVVIAVSTTLSTRFLGASIQSAGRILMISTFSIILAQHPFVKKLKGNINLGLFFGLSFLAIIGFCVDLRGFFGSAFTITLFCFSVILGSIILHLLITRLLKIKYEYVLLGITGAIADGTTAALVASSAKWNVLINIGLLMGILGGVCGNYIGIGVAYLIKAILGL